MSLVPTRAVSTAPTTTVADGPAFSSVESPLDVAKRLVHGARGEDYGRPIEDFSRTGRMWAAILGLDEVTAEQVAMCMVALKLSRECNRPKDDNVDDAAGYLETLWMVKEDRKILESKQGTAKSYHPGDSTVNSG